MFSVRTTTSDGRVVEDEFFALPIREELRSIVKEHCQFDADASVDPIISSAPEKYFVLVFSQVEAMNAASVNVNELQQDVAWMQIRVQIG
eukprot:5137617-Amphidinium_carterae.1